MRGIGNAAPRSHDRGNGVGVEFSGDRQAQPFLVKHNGGLELLIEGVREILRRFGQREVTEVVEVLLQLRHAADLAAPLGVKEL